MKIKIGVRIMATTKRTEFLQGMLDKLNMSDEIIIYNDNTTPYRAFKNTMRTMLDDNTLTHCLILQDDLLLVDDFLEFVEIIVKKYPDVAWSLYSSRIREIDLSRPYVKIRGSGVWGQAVLMPRKNAIHMMTWFDEWIKEDYKHDDRAVGNFLRINDIPTYTTSPSLIQHLAPTQSVIGYNNKHKISRVWMGEQLPKNIFLYGGERQSKDYMPSSNEGLKEEKRNGN